MDSLRIPSRDEMYFQYIVNFTTNVGRDPNPGELELINNYVDAMHKRAVEYM